jgi:predicted molibdopterin-dependent oxidoreductase YjgC
MIIKIDDREIQATPDQTILEAAEAGGIYIPHLCSHPELTSYGGCRLCIVEVKGLRGYPTACTTGARDGMVIRSNIQPINDMRKEIIQLMLSDHPVGCLLCDEEEECATYQSTIRKVGATTGCRWCPKDQDCELQKVVKFLNVKEMIFPVYYQGYEVEKDDPFFDRDYNLCIYCGRCVRICQEHRHSHIISLNQRGKEVTIGPAYQGTHLEADCEFCGACISVCPTGANYEKSRKWWGTPDAYHPSICPFCDLNCDLQLLTRGNSIIGSLPPGDPHQSGGELCVKGRFCIGELVNYPERLLEPRQRHPEGYSYIEWDEAIDLAARRLRGTDGARAAVALSPDLSLEELAAANYFAREVMGTRTISYSGLSDNLVQMAQLAESSIGAGDIEKSDSIFSLFLNGNYGYAPVTLAIKRAAARGVPYYQMGWFRDTTTRVTEKQITLEPGKETAFFRQMVNYLEKGSRANALIRDMVQTLRVSTAPTFVLGHQLIDLTDGGALLNDIRRIIELTGSRVHVTLPSGNVFGFLSLTHPIPHAELERLCAAGAIDLLYQVGDCPFETRPAVDFIIHQSPFPPPEKLQADLIFPSATWGEISGSFTLGSHERKAFRAVIPPPGKALENQEIFARIAKALDRKEVKFILGEVHDHIPADLTPTLPRPAANPHRSAGVASPSPAYPWALVQEKSPQLFQNISLNAASAGMRRIMPEDTLLMNPADAVKLGLQDKDVITIESAESRGSYPLEVRDLIQPGFVYLVTPGKIRFESNPCPVHIRRSHV